MNKMGDIFNNWDYGKTWFHGSPERLQSLRPGASITQNRRLAEAFSHKPSFTCIADDGSIRHDGVRQGWLYIVDEPITARDIRPYPPGERLPPGEEWLARRELKLKLVGPVEMLPDERLTPQEVEGFLRKVGKTAEELRSERLDLDQLRRLDENTESGQPTPRSGESSPGAESRPDRRANHRLEAARRTARLGRTAMLLRDRQHMSRYVTIPADGRESVCAGQPAA